MPKIDTLAAYSFSTPLELNKIFTRLNERGPWRWMERDSEYYGDYLSCLTCPEGAKIKIFEEGEQYVLNIRYKRDAPEAPAEWEELQRDIFERILPAVEARDLKPTEGYS